MAELEAEGRLGKLAHGHFRIVNGPPQRYRDDGVGWMLDPAIGGGGALRNLGIHGIDAALSLAQGALRVVSASIGNRIHDEPVEDHAHVTLRDEAGTLFTVEAGYTYASMAPGRRFRVADRHRQRLPDRSRRDGAMHNAGRWQHPNACARASWHALPPVHG